MTKLAAVFHLSLVVGCAGLAVWSIANGWHLAAAINVTAACAHVWRFCAP
jgi:hypothetical protein